MYDQSDIEHLSGDRGDASLRIRPFPHWKRVLRHRELIQEGLG